MKKWILTITAALAVLLFGLLLIVVLQPIRILVENKSSTSRSSISVSLNERVLQFDDLAPGAKDSLWFFYNGGDSGYAVSATKANGVEISYIDGYLTSGMFLHTTLIELRDNDEIYIRD